MLAEHKLYTNACRLKKSNKLSNADIYHMIMLHSYQHKSCSEIARQFGVTHGEVYEIIAGRASTTCCG